jgi:WD40 repeat protein
MIGHGRLALPVADGLRGVGALALSPNGRLLACGSGKTIVLISLPEGRHLNTFAAHDADIRALTFTTDGRMLASGSGDCLIRLWWMPSCKSAKTVANVFSAVNALAVTPDGRWLISGSGFLKGDLAIWSLPTGEAAGNLAGHEHSVTGLAIAPDGSYLASAGGGKVRLWALPGAKQPTVILDNGNADHDMDFLRAGKVLGCVADDGDVRMWLVPQGNDLGSLTGLRHPVVGLAALPGKEHGLVAVDAGGTVWVGNAVTRRWKALTPSSQGNV